MSEAMRPDPEAVLKRLKDFQRTTVDYVFQRMYDPQRPAKRFLVADEVGLGKTLVARGLIAKTIDHLWDDPKIDRIDVVYVCSNSDIARQNINRLSLPDCGHFNLTKRLTLLPTVLKDLRKKRINLVSFTPATSFDLRSSTGIVEERALLYVLLHKMWKFEGSGPATLLRVDAQMRRFKAELSHYRTRKVRVDRRLAKAFRKQVRIGDLALRKDGKHSLRRRFMTLARQVGRRRRLSRDESRERNAIVGELRGLLAATCITALEPDLIILDEFQRFKHLLNEESEAGELARHLFDAATEPRVLLLSATPYKMYTMSQEAAVDDHYSDFLDTLKFLLNDPIEHKRFEQLLASYRKALYSLAEGGGAELQSIKQQMERGLRRVMVRTERLAVTEDRNGMLREMPSRQVKLGAGDVAHYLSLQLVSEALGAGDVTEYWKSAPFLLNFMDNYDLKRALEASASRPTPELLDLLRSKQNLMLPWADIKEYAAVDPSNARLRSLAADVIDNGAWKLLWLLPALPYYRLGGPFSDPQLASFTKRLVFSTWQIVPKAIATLLSYEAERRMIKLLDPQAKNTAAARKQLRPLLRFTRSQGRLTGMPVLGLMYPSLYLSQKFSVLGLRSSDAQLLPVDDVVRKIASQIEPDLREITKQARPSDRPDESWYWAAPVLLDLRHFEESTRGWFDCPNLAEIWAGQSDGSLSESGGAADEDGPSSDSGWSDHVAEVAKLLDKKIVLGTPPKDLAMVLAQIAVAGPAVAALRSFYPLAGPAFRDDLLPDLMDGAARIGWAIRSLFNAPESIALVRGMNAQEPYWRRVLEYCLNGCLQAVFDEYAHVAWEINGFNSKDFSEAIGEMASHMSDVISLRTAVPRADDIRATVDGTIAITSQPLRTRFAMRFDNERGEDGRETHRRETVRQAFNSPFWPFVLATTSVGQEGLDFHTYCHAVVHWNLPSNPVDLEQREGRVHRYKGHAVRKNVATSFGKSFQTDSGSDPWTWMFSAAVAERKGHSDLVPFWVYPIENGAAIERHVPVLPLSRDWDRLPSLKNSLAIYRMVFGQPRQEDLLNYLLSRVPKERLLQEMDSLRIDLSPPKSAPIPPQGVDACLVRKG